ncbi:MAG: GerMN domain-containing protein [Deltaproteobacteria bacterium]|nr:GerMN domain-containing protein [Deltaproteobacteria bacterium]
MNRGSDGVDGASAARRRRGAETRAPWLIVLVAALAGAGVALLAVWLFGGPGTPEPPILQPPSSGTAEATLYFADPRWTRLLAEPRALRLPAEGAARVRGLVEALGEGPRQAGAPVLPKAAKVRGVYLAREGVAVIDFDPEIAEVGAGGASGELLSVYALVHTIAANVPGVQSIQLLVNGQERETLAGHVKISHPLRPDPQLVAEPGR